MKGSTRHIPLRTCINCGNKTEKRDLVRIVATPQGTVEVDPTGKMPSRGAYLCKTGECAIGPLKKGRMEYALRTSLKDEAWAELASFLTAIESTR
jgi:predicted RNA-binding protein YlxR (DUF448 family)